MLIEYLSIGWVVTFMLDVRHGAAFASGMTVSHLNPRAV